MIVRLRLRAGVYISALLLLVGMALAAHATQAVAGEAVGRAELYATIGACGGVTFAAFWVLLNSQVSRIAQGIERLDSTVSRFYDSLSAHDRNPYAHGEASEHNHKPLEDKIDRLSQRFDDYIMGGGGQ